MLQTPLSDEAREYATTVRDSAESLLAIVNDILDFSKIEAGRMELESVPFAPVVARRERDRHPGARPRARRVSRSSTYVAPDVPRRVLGDADRLRQVLLNLLGNAVKFTAHGQRHGARRRRRARRRATSCCASRSPTPAPASRPTRPSSCSSRSARPISRRAGASAERAWACRSRAASSS